MRRRDHKPHIFAFVAHRLVYRLLGDFDGCFESGDVHLPSGATRIALLELLGGERRIAVATDDAQDVAWDGVAVVRCSREPA